MDSPQKDDQKEYASMLKRVTAVGWIAIGLAFLHVVFRDNIPNFMIWMPQETITHTDQVRWHEVTIVIGIGLLIILFRRSIANLAVKEKEFWDKSSKK